MKLKIFDICIILFVLLLVAGAITSICIKFHKRNELIKQSPMEPRISAELELPIYTKKLAEQYKIYPELFNSTERVFVYSYNTNSFKKNYDLKFRKDLILKLENENLNYKYLGVKNWRETDDLADFIGVKDISDCTDICIPKGVPKEDAIKLENIMDIVNKCLKRACIIDMEHNKYTIMTKDPDYILTVLKRENKPAK